MVKEYSTVVGEATGEIVEKKSRFIGYIRHVESEEEAVEFVASIRKKHFDARHNCYAYMVGSDQPLSRFSDDGEPGGTAGKPILEVITGNGLSDVCLVVTRYFGGTLLGTGGLVRAYSDAAAACVGEAELVTKRRVLPVTIESDYTDLGKLQYILGREGIEILESEYGAQVCLKTDIFVDDAERILKEMTEVTAARVVLTRGDETFSVRRGRKG